MKSLKLCLMTLYHPIVVTEHIKRHRGEKKNWLPVIVLLVLTLAVRILSIYGTHYPLASVSVRKANLLLECGKLFVPVLTWVLASYMMTTILDGETLLSETLLFSAYALTPYIVFTPILTLASRIMDGSQIGLFATLEVGEEEARDVGYGRPLGRPVPADPTALLHAGALLALYRPQGDGSVPVAVLV